MECIIAIIVIVGWDNEKVRVTVPEDIYRIMRNDMEDFGVNNNKLCNYIFG